MNETGFENLLLTHGVCILGRLHGFTRIDACGGDEAERAQQIKEYVDSVGDCIFVVLDDLDIPIENLVRTNGDVGLTPDDARRAIELLHVPMFQ